MQSYPVIQSPCPYKGKLTDILDGSVCRLCEREVHDIGAMSEADRIAFVSGCQTEVCVSYKVPANSAIAAAALGLAAVSVSPAMAQEGAGTAQPVHFEPAASDMLADEGFVIIVGGMRAPDKAEWQKDRPVTKGRELPVIIEKGDGKRAEPLRDQAKRT